MSVKRVFNYLVVGMAVAELLIILLSWLLSATMTEGVRSLLSGEGLRWFFGSFVALLSSPWLVWLLLLSMAAGSLLCSHLLRDAHSSTYRHRIAFRTSLVVLILYVAMVVALTAVPHAVLLSATGQLFPSAFSRALVPLVAFGICLVSIVYGLMAGSFQNLSDAVASLSYGIAKAAPLFVFYVLAAQLVASLRFVF